jgi:hypothetical protein
MFPGSLDRPFDRSARRATQSPDSVWISTLAFTDIDPLELLVDIARGLTGSAPGVANSPWEAELPSPSTNTSMLAVASGVSGRSSAQPLPIAASTIRQLVALLVISPSL